MFRGVIYDIKKFSSGLAFGESVVGRFFSALPRAVTWGAWG
jgi:hypothetical protein